MKTFIAKLKDIVGTERHPVSMSPRDVLFGPQRRFLEKIFDTAGIRNRSVDIEVPQDGGPIVFRCDISTRVNVHTVIDHVVYADWGDFEVKRIHVACADKDGRDYDWFSVSFFVDCDGDRCKYDWYKELQRAEETKTDTAKAEGLK